jgi:hypothetical protein
LLKIKKGLAQSTESCVSSITVTGMKFFVIPVSTYNKLKSQVKDDIQPPKTSEVMEHIEEKSEGGEDDFILESFSKSTKEKASRLLSYLKRYSSIISWSPNGNVNINTKILPNTNIVDLVRTAVNGTRKKPVGWIQFHQVLKHINTPLSLISTSPPGTPAKTSKWLIH